MSTYFACEDVFTKQLIELLLILNGDVEQDPVSEEQKSYITFCHWNLNGLMAHNFIKFSLLPTLAVTNDNDIICSFLDFSIQKQPSRGVLRKRCSENMQQIYRRTPMPWCDFNKFVKQLY